MILTLRIETISKTSFDIHKATLALSDNRKIRLQCLETRGKQVQVLASHISNVLLQVKYLLCKYDINIDNNILILETNNINFLNLFEKGNQITNTTIYKFSQYARSLFEELNILICYNPNVKCDEVLYYDYIVWLTSSTAIKYDGNSYKHMDSILDKARLCKSNLAKYRRLTCSLSNNLEDNTLIITKDINFVNDTKAKRSLDKHKHMVLAYA